MLGATESQVLWIFGKEFSRLMVMGFLLVAPLGWFLMKNRLQRYAYKIELGWWVLALTAGAVGLITVLTISFQSIRAAHGNPVAALRSE